MSLAHCTRTIIEQEDTTSVVARRQAPPKRVQSVRASGKCVQADVTANKKGADSSRRESRRHTENTETSVQPVTLGPRSSSLERLLCTLEHTDESSVMRSRRTQIDD